MAQVMEKTFCLPCRVGLHHECDDLWAPGMTPKDPCCCEGIDFWAQDAPTVSEDMELTPADLAYFDGFTGTKRLEEYADPVSTGRKEAAVKFPIEKGMACEWKYLAQAGGGVAPIVGCVGYPATDIHHGPDKNTLHNTPDNVHRICAHCFAPETLVLTRDLRWVRVDSLGLGDELVGFDEDIKHGVSELKPTTVMGLQTVLEPSYRLSFSDGTTTTSSHKHKWVASSPARHHLKWRTTESLKVGYNLRRLVTPWVEDKTWEAGWLAGMYDGEGSLTRYHLNNGQRDSPTLDKLIEAITSRTAGTVSQQFRPAHDNNKDFHTVRVTNLADILTILGSVRPPRLLAKAEEFWVGKSPFIVKDNRMTIVDIEYLGEIEVISLQTTTGTLIADGLLSHNCHNRWHALNDPYYPAERPPADEPFLPDGDKVCLLHDPSTKATDDVVFAEEKRRRDDSRRHGNLD